MQPGQKSNIGTAAAVIGGIAAVGGIVAAALASGSKKSSGGSLSGSRLPPRKLGKKPCGCGR